MVCYNVQLLHGQYSRGSANPKEKNYLTIYQQLCFYLVCVHTRISTVFAMKYKNLTKQTCGPACSQTCQCGWQRERHNVLSYAIDSRPVEAHCCQPPPAPATHCLLCLLPRVTKGARCYLQQIVEGKLRWGMTKLNLLIIQVTNF